MDSGTKLGNVDLLPGEIPLETWYANHKASWLNFKLGSGLLYLTSERLVYTDLGWPKRDSDIVISLDQVIGCRYAKGGWRGLLIVDLKDGNQVKFHPVRVAPFSEEIAFLINTALKETGRVHA